jgi:hypothetical protein
MQQDIALELHNAIAAVCPIQGVSIGNLADKATWRIDYDPAATAPQKQAAQAVITSFNVNALTPQGRIANGIAITSTGSPALNATYAIDPVAQGHITSVATYINTNARFPAGLAPFPWPDITGVQHSFQSTAQFLQFATACADIVTQIQFGLSPTQAATIV